jgi:hypothetical protein
MWLLILKITLQVFAVGVMILVNLLDYVTHDKETRQFKIARFVLFVVSGVFLIASIVVVVLDDLDKKDEIQKLAHPIGDVSISFQVSIPLSHSSLESYHKHFESNVNKAATEFSMSQTLQEGLSIRNDDSITILPRSSLFPNRTSEKLAYYLINYIGLSVEFYKGYREFSQSLKDPDISFTGYASVDGHPSNSILSQYYGNASLFYNFPKRQLAIDIWGNKPSPEFWKSNRKIISIPDLKDSLMVVQFFGYMIIDDSNLRPHLEDARRAVTVDAVVLKISGQEFRFSQSSMFQQHQLDNCMTAYAVRFDKAG